MIWRAPVGGCFWSERARQIEDMRVPFAPRKWLTIGERFMVWAGAGFATVAAEQGSSEE